MIRPRWVAAAMLAPVALAGLAIGLAGGLLATVAGDQLAERVVEPADVYRSASSTTTTEVASTVTSTPAPTPSSTSTTEAVGADGPPHERTAPAPSVPLAEVAEGGTARVSWYASESGTHTANGERYDPAGLTFAHKSMAFGTAVRFCGPTGCVVARCSDRGPFVDGRSFDLSRAAFAEVASLDSGVAIVTWAVVG